MRASALWLKRSSLEVEPGRVCRSAARASTDCAQFALWLSLIFDLSMNPLNASGVCVVSLNSELVGQRFFRASDRHGRMIAFGEEHNCLDDSGQHT